MRFIDVGRYPLKTSQEAEFPASVPCDWQTTFAGRQIVAAGLEDVVDKMTGGQPIDQADASLLTNVSLPLLGKLIEWQDAVRPECVATTNYEQFLAPWNQACDELFALRASLFPENRARWTLRLPCPLDGLTDSLSGATDFAGNPTGAEVLRILSLARLIFPPEVEVSALASELGEKVACVAGSFGVVVQPATSDKVTL